MAAKVSTTKETSVYFPDAALIKRIDKLAKSTGITRNKIIVAIIEKGLAAFEKKPALLIGG